LVVGVLLDPFAAAGLIDLGLAVRFARFPDRFRLPGRKDAGLVVGVLLDPLSSARASSALKVSVWFGFAQFPDRFSRTEHQRCGLGGRRSARSIRSARASSSLKVPVWWSVCVLPRGQYTSAVKRSGLMPACI
jgi:hypothetical protein